MLFSRTFAALCLITVVTACDEGGEKAGAEAGAEGVAEEVEGEAKEAAKAISDEKKGKKKKDRGEGKATIGGVAWSGDSAKARLKDDKLTIKISNTDMNDGVVTRQELHLRVEGFKGPGEYTTPLHGSRFISVGMDSKKAAAAQKKDEAAGNDEETTKTVTGMISDAGHIMIVGAKVKISAASDTEISGTFSYDSPQGEKTSMSDGSFRAVIPPPKK